MGAPLAPLDLRGRRRSRGSAAGSAEVGGGFAFLEFYVKYCVLQEYFSGLLLHFAIFDGIGLILSCNS
jgi:hypothetical protein